MKKLFQLLLLGCVFTMTSVTANASGLLTSEELALLQDEIYYVGYSTKNAPVTYLDSDGQMAGMAYEVLQELAKEYGLQFEFVDVDITTGNDLRFLSFTTLMKHENIRPASTPYIQFPFIEVRLSSFEGDPNHVGIANVHGIDSLEEVRAGLASLTPTVYESFNLVHSALLAEEIDTMITTTLAYVQLRSKVESGDYLVEFLENTAKYRVFYNETFPEEKQILFNRLFSNLSQSFLHRLDVEHSFYNVNSTIDSNGTAGSSGLTATPNVDSSQARPLFGDGVWFGLIVALVAILALVKNKDDTERALDFDKLTKLYTQEKWLRETSLVLKSNQSDPYTILALDIDNFKYINEVYGFKCGNSVLIALALAINSNKDGETLVGRISADNFVVLYKGGYQSDRIRDHGKVYEEVRISLNRIIGEDFNLTFSVGVFEVIDHQSDVNYMVDCAITARNIGKKVAANTINTYTDAMSKEREISNRIITTMHAAIENREFVMYYQSKIDLENEKLVGAEALVRWIKDGKVIPPNDFIPVFEKNGFIEKLDYYVLEAVCIYIKENSGLHFPTISINLSGITLMQDNLVEKIVEIIQKHDVSPGQLELEITESAFVNIYEKNILKLVKLQEFGFAISMDDFGTGVSSLQRLNDFPLNTLKVDRSFVVKSTLEQKGASILSSIVQMAKELDLETVGEGVETEQQLDLLKSLGCDMVQGYYYSRPLNGAEFIEKYAKFLSGTA